jgi:hypothetical protein
MSCLSHTSRAGDKWVLSSSGMVFSGVNTKKLGVEPAPLLHRFVWSHPVDWVGVPVLRTCEVTWGLTPVSSVKNQRLAASPKHTNAQCGEECRIFSLLSLFWRKKFWEELIAYFPLKRHGPHRKRKIGAIHWHTSRWSHKPPFIFSLLSIFKKIRGGLWDRLAAICVCVSVSLCPSMFPPLIF